MPAATSATLAPVRLYITLTLAGVSCAASALRSPVRPNPVSLSVVELLAVDGNVLSVRGLDCLDGTPLIDIKPYFASTDSRPDARVGWSDKR